MKAERRQIDRALQAPTETRCLLFHGPDEAGSAALARRLVQAMGPEAERITLTGAELKADPARLADEAAAISMFGGARVILVEPAGDEATDAVAALLDLEIAGNPVALVASTLKPTSKLLKLMLAAPNGLAFASYLPNARDWDKMVVQMARERGLDARPDVAMRIAEGAGGNRAVIEQELDKFALYVGAEPGRMVPLDHDAIAAVGAARDEGDTSTLVEHLFDGNGAGVEDELARLRSEGTEGITLIRAALRRATVLAKLRAAMSHGESAAGAMASQGKSLFWKDKDSIARQLPNWPADRVARCIERLSVAERAVKASGGIGPLAVDAELLTIARQAGRRR